MEHITQSKNNVWPCVLGGVGAGVAVGVALAHVYMPSWCTPKKHKPQIKLTYFDIAGVAEQVRLSFALGGVEFEDERIKFPQWAELKPKTPYGQLPLMNIDGKQITQSDAMLRFSGSLTPALYPESQTREIDEVLGLVADFKRDWAPNIYIAIAPARFGYPESFKGSDEQKAKIKEMREHFVAEELPKWVGYFEARLAKSGAFLCGSQVTLADCALVPELRKFQQGYMDHVPTTSLDKFPVLLAYIDRFMSVPAVKAFYKK